MLTEISQKITYLKKRNYATIHSFKKSDNTSFFFMSMFDCALKSPFSQKVWIFILKTKNKSLLLYISFFLFYLCRIYRKVLYYPSLSSASLSLSLSLCFSFLSIYLSKSFILSLPLFCLSLSLSLCFSFLVFPLSLRKLFMFLYSLFIIFLQIPCLA